jgi:hypothetical protein
VSDKEFTCSVCEGKHVEWSKAWCSICGKTWYACQGCSDSFDGESKITAMRDAHKATHTTSAVLSTAAASVGEALERAEIFLNAAWNLSSVGGILVPGHGADAALGEMERQVVRIEDRAFDLRRWIHEETLKNLEHMVADLKHKEPQP